MLERWGSLRARLALWYGICGALLLAGFGGVIYWYVSNRVARPLDYSLRQAATLVEQHLTVSEAGRALWDGAELAAGETKGVPWFEVWDERGQLILRYWSVDESKLERLPVAPAPGRETLSVFSLSSEVRLRVLSLPWSRGAGQPDWMVRVVHEHQPMVEALGALRGIILVALPIVILLLVGGGWLVTWHWMRPLQAVVAEAELIDARDLQRRLPVANPRDEIGRLATVFNSTLSRLEDSFTALDHFVADASHELRTPLTTLRSVGELALERARTPEEYRDVIGSMLEEAQRLQRLVERLLELARAEGGALAATGQATAVDELARALVADFAVLAEENQQQLRLITQPVRFLTDPVLLRQAILNLIDNALKYSPPRSMVTVVVERVDAECLIKVRDEGPGLAPDHVARPGDRFQRAGLSAFNRRGGFGLGLAITRAYLRVLGGRLDYEAGDGGGSCFVITLPIRTPAEAF